MPRSICIISASCPVPLPEGTSAPDTMCTVAQQVHLYQVQMSRALSKQCTVFFRKTWDEAQPGRLCSCSSACTAEPHCCALPPGVQALRSSPPISRHLIKGKNRLQRFQSRNSRGLDRRACTRYHDISSRKKSAPRDSAPFPRGTGPDAGRCPAQSV